MAAKLRLGRASKDSSGTVHVRRFEAGATMVEFTFVALTLMVLTLAFIDVLRFFGVRGSLIRGAQTGMTMAEQISGFEQDARDDTAPPGGCPSTPADTPMTQIRCGRQAVIKEATRIPLSFMVDPPGTVGSASVLTGYENHIPYNYDSAGGTWSDWSEGTEEAAGVLRPGESTCSNGETGGCGGGTPKWICHPTMYPPTGCPDAAAPPRPLLVGGTGWNEILHLNPYVVLLRAQMFPIVPWPFLPSQWIVNASALGFREPARSYKIMPDMGIPIKPVIPTPANAPTPLPTPNTCLCCGGRDYAGNCVAGCFLCTCPAFDPC